MKAEKRDGEIGAADVPGPAGRARRTRVRREPLKAKLACSGCRRRRRVHRAGQGYFKDAGIMSAEILRRAQPIAVSTTSGDVSRHHRVHRGLYTSRQGHAEGDRRHEPREGRHPLIGYFQHNAIRRAEDPERSCRQARAVTQVGSSFHYSLGCSPINTASSSRGKVLPLHSLSNAAAPQAKPSTPLLPASTARKLIDDGGAKLLAGSRRHLAIGRCSLREDARQQALVTKLLAALARATAKSDVILASVTGGRRRSTMRQNRC